MKLSWLGLSRVFLCLALSLVWLSPLYAQNSQTPSRSIPLPADCQHPLRQLYLYDSGQRIGVKSSAGFCRVDVGNGEVKKLGALRELQAVGPAPRSAMVALVSTSRHLSIVDDNGQSQFEADLESSAGAIYWSSDESRVVVFSYLDESDKIDTAMVINIRKKTMKTISFDPPATVKLDAQSNTLNAMRESGKAWKETVYDLEGKAVRSAVAQKPQRERSYSASRKYFYVPRYEVGEGDIAVRLSSTGRTILRLPEYKQMGSDKVAIWDDPQWNPADDDLLLILYLSDCCGKGKAPTEFDVFSISKGKSLRVFPLGENGTPAYGWSADGKHVILCDVVCGFY